MNMLNPEMRALASFTKEEQELFQENRSSIEKLVGSGKWVDRTYPNTHAPECGVYRLKLKEGEFYTFTEFGVNKTCNRKINESIAMQCELFRPATREEIASVQPEFKLGDVAFRERDGVVCRFGFSFIDCGGTLIFSDSSGMKTDHLAFKKVDSKTKQLEHQEMLHGKKWNAEKGNYDDFLTDDGLTLKELLKHDLSEIEYKNGGVWKTSPHANFFTEEWIKENVFSGDGVCACRMHNLRLKPDPSFVDVEITWKSTEANIIPPFNKNARYDLCDFKVGIPRGGWVLSGYVFNGVFNGVELIVFTYSGTVIEEKATHARFVRIDL